MLQMKNLISIGSVAISSIALNLLPANPARAASLAGGSANLDFTPTTATTQTKAWGSYNSADSTTIPNWTSEGYNFIVPSGTAVTTYSPTPGLNFYGSASGLSAPNGAGYYIAADSSYQAGYIFQQLTNLTIGATYSVSFYQAAAQQNQNSATSGSVYTGATTDQWLVNVGGTYTKPGNQGGENSSAGSFSGGDANYSAPVMSLASQGNAGSQTTPGNPTVNGWQQDSFAFTATNVSESISFLATRGATPTGRPPFALLSGVSVNKIPEPADYVGTLVGFGFVGLAIKSRLAKKKLDE
jgi:hypothetical protein